MIFLTVTRINLQLQELTFDQDDSQEITFVVEDIDSEAFTYSIVAPPTKGKLSEITDSKVAYIPNEGNLENTYPYNSQVTSHWMKTWNHSSFTKESLVFDPTSLANRSCG